MKRISDSLTKILKVLKHINQQKKLVSNMVMQEEEENILDCKKEEEELYVLLARLQRMTDKEFNEIITIDGETISTRAKLLIDLNMHISNYIWQFEEINELIIDMIKNTE